MRRRQEVVYNLRSAPTLPGQAMGQSIGATRDSRQLVPIWEPSQRTMWANTRSLETPLRMCQLVSGTDRTLVPEAHLFGLSRSSRDGSHPSYVQES